MYNFGTHVPAVCKPDTTQQQLQIVLALQVSGSACACTRCDSLQLVTFVTLVHGFMQVLLIFCGIKLASVNTDQIRGMPPSHLLRPLHASSNIRQELPHAEGVE
jgi:hypothetical protein